MKDDGSNGARPRFELLVFSLQPTAYSLQPTFRLQLSELVSLSAKHRVDGVPKVLLIGYSRDCPVGKLDFLPEVLG